MCKWGCVTFEWANAPSLKEEDRISLWNILEMNYHGLSKIPVRDIIHANPSVLKLYSDAFSLGILGGKRTIQFKELDTLKGIDFFIPYILTLTQLIPSIYKIINWNFLLKLTTEQAYYFSDYYSMLKPTFSSNQKKELIAIGKFIIKKYDIRALMKSLPSIKSFHKFDGACIAKLQSDFSDTTNNKPLTIILFPDHDPSGAFTRSEEIKAIISNKNIIVILT